MTKRFSAATAAYAHAIARPRGERPIDVCVFGCTGNAGKAVAYHVCQSAAMASGTNAPIKVGLAGRSRDKVEKVLKEISDSGKGMPEVEIVIADANDYSTLLSMAKSTSVLICCAGPYGRYGEPSVKACVEAGTHYVDITGEVPWVERMAAEYGSEAEKNGAALLSFSGYDCIPSELPMYLAGRALEKQDGSKLTSLDLAFESKGGGLPHGTLETVLDALDGKVTQRKEGDPYFYPAAYRPVAKSALSAASFAIPKWSSHVSSYTSLNIMAAVNVPILCKSASVLGYGPDLAISDRQLPAGIRPSASSLYGLVPSVVSTLTLAFLGIMTLFPPVRWLFRNKLKTYSFGGNLDGSVDVHVRGTSSHGEGSVADVAMHIPGDPGIYATGLFAAAVSMALLEATTKTAETDQVESEGRPLAGFYPPVAALHGCETGLLVKHLQRLGTELKVSVGPSVEKMEVLDPVTL